MRQFLFICCLFLSNAAKAQEIENKLTLWINGDKGYNGLATVAQRFAKDAGIEVVVAHPAKVEEKFQQAASTGSGPDIFFWPHDRYGQWAASGLIAPLHITPQVRSRFEPLAWDAMTIGNAVYGYPVSIEAVSLIYNKALIDQAPTQFEDIPAIDRQLAQANKRAIMWAYNVPYFSYPLLSAGGGYAFKKQGHFYNVQDTGVAHPGAKLGLNYIVGLIKQGYLDKGIDYGVMDARFNQGEVAMMINGPWSWRNIEKSKIDYGVAPLPTLNGKPARAFVGVLGAMINAASPNKDLAVEFLENHLLTPKGLAQMNADKPLGAVALKAYQKVLEKDTRIQATMHNARQGEIMPSVVQMNLFWDALEVALNNATSGRQSVEKALEAAQVRIVQKR